MFDRLFLFKQYKIKTKRIFNPEQKRRTLNTFINLFQTNLFFHGTINKKRFLKEAGLSIIFYVKIKTIFRE